MPIELIAGEQKQLDVTLIPLGVGGLFIERLFVVSSPSGDRAFEYIYCHIRNTGATPITEAFTSNILGFDVFEEPQLYDKRVSFTVNPGEVFQYRREWHIWEIGARAETWIVGDWGEESLHLKWTCGYKYPYPFPENGGELHAVDVGPNYAVLRYAEDSIYNRWTFRYKTPPLPPYVHMDEFSLTPSDPTHSIHCAIWDLLPGSTYEAHASGYAKEAWTQFTTL